MSSFLPSTTLTRSTLPDLDSPHPMPKGKFFYDVVTLKVGTGSTTFLHIRTLIDDAIG